MRSSPTAGGCPQRHSTVHLNVRKTVNSMLYKFYDNKKNPRLLRFHSGVLSRLSQRPQTVAPSVGKKAGPWESSFQRQTDRQTGSPLWPLLRSCVIDRKLACPRRISGQRWAGCPHHETPSLPGTPAGCPTVEPGSDADRPA